MNESVIKELVLKNAVSHKGKSVAGAIIPKILGQEPELKSEIKKLMPTIQKIVKEINSMNLDAQKKELLKIDSHALDKKVEIKELPEIKDIVVGKCSFRLPPGPEKQLHVGHSFSFLLNNYYAKKYKGKLILRFEDTNPEKCEQVFVNGIKEDLKALGITWDQEYFLSDNMNEYYKLAEKLIKQGDAYACTCSSEIMKKNRENHVSCACSKLDINANLRFWNKMKYGTYREGECVLRLKADMKSKNSVMWDPVIFRMNHTKHYRQGSKYKIWPLYDFTASVEDAKITHVLRDSNWTQRIELQDFIRVKLGIKSNPVNVLFSRFEIEGGVTKGRVIRELVDKGIVSGYDDIRLSTVKGFLRRGILPETLMEVLIDTGISKSKTTIPMEKINTINRRILAERVSHYFFVEEPVLINVKDKGEYYIQKSDFKKGIIRLKDSFNIDVKKDNLADYAGEDLIKGAPVIQWVEKDDAVSTEVVEALPLFNDKDELNKTTLIVHKGVISKKASQLPVGTQVQFERFGYAKKETNNWIFTHP